MGDKTIAFFLMDREMYSGMSCLTDASPTIERGVALHKVFLLLLYKKQSDAYCFSVHRCLSEQSLSYTLILFIVVFLMYDYQTAPIMFTTYITDKIAIYYSS